MDHIKAALEIFKRHPVEWILTGLVFAVASQMMVGIFLMPNFIRIARKAAPADAPAPEIGDLFKLDDIGDDILTVLILIAATFAGICACFVGATVVTVLGFWTQHLRADRLYAPVDCLKASFHHAKSNIGEIVVMMLLVGVISMVGTILTCCLGVFLVSPFMVITFERFYAANRDAIIAAADQNGVPRLA